jgi:C4-dicarboxylate-specific signal transduction histidine kinase
MVLLDRDGRVLFWNRPAQEALGGVGRELPLHLRELPTSGHLPTPAEWDSEPTPDDAVPGGVRKIADSVWAIRIPVVEADPERLQSMVAAEQMAAVGQLAATVAMEIGGPNASIQVAIDHLLESKCGPGRDEEVELRRILTQTERITRLTRQLIALAEPGKARLEPVSLNDLATSALELFESSFSDDGVTVERELDADDVVVSADRNQLLQAVVNLMLNARSALREWEGEKRVTLRTDADAARGYLHVSDSGPGVPEGEAFRIFLPFVSTTGGTGLGLYLTRQILQEQGGGIRVRSNSAPGATFTVNLEKVRHE